MIDITRYPEPLQSAWRAVSSCSQSTGVHLQNDEDRIVDLAYEVYMHGVKISGDDLREYLEEIPWHEEELIVEGVATFNGALRAFEKYAQVFQRR